ncbi:sugar phosphate isomerase/epimerase family protein [Paenibacillus abyssi]|uniref:Xylose isomerase-like TIM barrel domain-containing protein n=1 Tax=Paenibacillus abyssi TaxID=1340531 RepID=A0A917G6Q1_9BACL|nr:sugar phosphate isomerase/epimerase [Paenibacillus abyssi]GGG25566.1 hypothetical protein GCM10010916_47530 [Paenibacillus abyssi]
MTFQIGMRISPKIGAEGIDRVAAWAAEAGLDVIDVPYYNSEIKETLESHSLQVGSIDAIGSVGQTKLLSMDENKRGDAVKTVMTQFSDIAALGGKTVFMCLVPEDLTLSREKSFGIWKETFPDIVKHAEQQGIFIVLEGWPGPAPYYPTIGCTPEMLRAMFNEIPSRHFALNYDPSHLIRQGIDYLRFLSEFGERVSYCHGKDTEILRDEMYECGHLAAAFGPKYDFSEGSWRYTIPGYGEADWGKIAVRLDRLGYEGPISIELEDHRYWGSLEAERQGIIKAKEHLEKYFK